MIAGSAPALDRSVTPYPTCVAQPWHLSDGRSEYRVEWLSPPYMQQPRPSFGSLPAQLRYGRSIELKIKLPAKTRQVTASLIDLGCVSPPL